MSIKTSEEEKRASRKRWYLKNKQKLIERALLWEKKFKEENPEKFKEMRRESTRKWSQTPKGIYKAMHQNSKRVNRKFDINKNEFIEWHNNQKKVCYYCGLKQTNKRMSIDRKNNDIGYSIDNIVLACDDCNRVKGNVLTEEEMLIVGKIIMKKRWQKLSKQ